ncbi:basic secretory peptidase family protein [Leeuwenhoekiella aestuarii]|uniref:Basic secretory peptidase family protein n=1 Tax=Leeuwenhoekiella aestuarii TaxID=2249426 RepID=A0A4Q0NSL5_9FLAO|nr:basic secretory protein-like protein [Leeuwenhoekiella aestuarii]RXG13215.1 basic secretory peptidase family protein [Leeuwenhoekiella aestuarii]RXG15049.1 basic secretory peptidase family protein [Leeuwenhoekiella aestuarii]
MIKTLSKYYILALIAVVISGNLQAQKYTLTYTSQDDTLDPSIQKGIEKIFKKVYPKLVKDFNKNSQKHVTIKIDTAYDGVAYAHQGAITISSAWLHKKPEDLDLVTHELMHLVQSYPGGAGPGWLTEGIADYVRYKYALDNDGAGWSLTPFSPNQNYENSYRITARFLLWITQNYDKNLVKKLDYDLRNKKYTLQTWKDYTGKTVDELWQEYASKPSVNS